MTTVPHADGGPTGSDRLRLLARYCEVGWRLLPTWWLADDGTCACRERDACDRPGKHPRIAWQNPPPGRSGATSDPAVVTEWLRLWPRANWAVVCEDFFVVDVDRKHGGMATLADVEVNAPELLETTLSQKTSGGGRQFLHAQPPERDVVTLGQDRFGTAAGLPGWEIKGLSLDLVPGSYVLVPPSAGRMWLTGGVPAPASEFLLHRIREVTARRPVAASGSASGEIEVFDWNRALTPGAVTVSQDDTLYRAALSLRAQGVNDALAVAVLRRVIECFVNLDPRDPWDVERAGRKWEYVKRRHEEGRTAPRLSAEQRRWAAATGQGLNGQPRRFGRVTLASRVRGDR